MGLQVPQSLETQESGSFLWQLQAWWGQTGVKRHLTKWSYQSVDSMRAKSEEGRLGLQLLAGVQSCEHNGTSKELKGSPLGWGVGRGQIMMVPQAKKVLSKGEM